MLDRAVRRAACGAMAADDNQVGMRGSAGKQVGGVTLDHVRGGSHVRVLLPPLVKNRLEMALRGRLRLRRRQP